MLDLFRSVPFTPPGQTSRLSFLQTVNQLTLILKNWLTNIFLIMYWQNLAQRVVGTPPKLPSCRFTPLTFFIVLHGLPYNL